MKSPLKNTELVKKRKARDWKRVSGTFTYRREKSPRALTSTEVTQLWNGGDGIIYEDYGYPTVTAISPAKHTIDKYMRKH